MSLEITLYTKTATKNKLDKLLRENGFEKVQHFLESLNDDKHIHFMWIGFDNYESFSGVEATIYKVDSDTRKEHKCSEWILHTRTRAGCSRIDLKRQNDIIKKARGLFQGSFYNDWYGRNRYTNLDDYENLSAPERGLYLMYEHIHQKIDSIRSCLHDYEHPVMKTIYSMPDNGFRRTIERHDPSIVLFNSLLPFLVSLIEFMFETIFIILVKYDSRAQEIIKKENIKVPIRDVIDVSKSNLTVESIISRQYTFQNLLHVNKAFKKYLDIDIYYILSRKRKVGNRYFRLKDKLEEVIERRHDMIHHFSFDPTLRRNEFFELLGVVSKSIEILITHLEKKNGWTIRKIIYDDWNRLNV
ncbi:MAG: hypothetical protein AAF673_02660 [Pseudomonadota bacterium]